MERGPSSGDSFIPQTADYVKFSRYSFNSSGGAQYFNVPDNQSKSNKSLVTSAYIAMPNNLSVDYGAAYNQANLGALGRAATGALAGKDGAEGPHCNRQQMQVFLNLHLTIWRKVFRVLVVFWD